MARPTNAQLQSKVKELDKIRTRLETDLADAHKQLTKARAERARDFKELDVKARDRYDDLLREKEEASAAAASAQAKSSMLADALERIAGAGWPRLSSPLIQTAKDALVKLGEIPLDGDPLARLDRFVHSQEEVAATINYDGSTWSVMVNFGREAEDSPMTGGSLIGADVRLRPAIIQALSTK